MMKHIRAIIAVWVAFLYSPLSLYFAPTVYASQEWRQEETFTQSNINLAGQLNSQVLEQDVAFIAERLYQNRNIKSLDLSANNIDEHTAETLISGLHGNNALEDLKLANNKIGNLGCICLLEGFLGQEGGNSALQNLDLSDNGIEDWGIMGLDKALANSKLKSLNLSHNNLGSDSGSKIRTALESTTSLESLDLQATRIDYKGIKEIGEGLVRNTSLTSLDLQNNGLDDWGAISLCRALTYNKTLKYLNFNKNNIGEWGLRELLQTLAKNPSIEEISFADNPSINLDNFNKVAVMVVETPLSYDYDAVHHMIVRKARPVESASKEEDIKDTYVKSMAALKEALQAHKIEAVSSLVQFYKEAGSHLKSVVSEEEILELHNMAGRVLSMTFKKPLNLEKEFQEALTSVLE